QHAGLGRTAEEVPLLGVIDHARRRGRTGFGSAGELAGYWKLERTGPLNFLKRELAPLTDEAWKYVEEEAVRALSANLSDRRVVDVTEPKGFDFSAVNLGTLSPSHLVEGGVHYGVRQVLPLVEIRVPIELDIWTLDNLSRGATDVDTDAVTQAALKVSAF